MKPRRTISCNETEFLLVLYHLRYVTARQAHRLWYANRNQKAVALRLGRLVASDVLMRQYCVMSNQAVYTLGLAGRRHLRRTKPGDFHATQTLGAVYLPHHIATNDIFTTLAQGPQVVWSQLPFTWTGTLGTAIPFEQTRRDAFGIAQTRAALLRPDAIVTSGTDGPRSLIELDRSTECLREADVRRSIRGKLRAYATLFSRGPGTGVCTWYNAAFADKRPVRVLFVLARIDRRSAQPDWRDRRLHAIAAAARELAPCVAVQCLYLRDEAGLRQACLVPETTAPPPYQALQSQGATPEELQQLAAFYRLAVPELKNGRNPDAVLRQAARAAKAVLNRLKNTGEIQ